MENNSATEQHFINKKKLAATTTGLVLGAGSGMFNTFMWVHPALKSHYSEENQDDARIFTGLIASVCLIFGAFVGYQLGKRMYEACERCVGNTSQERDIELEQSAGTVSRP